LNYLRSILKASVSDDEASIYTIRLLMESNRIEEQNEDRTLLRRLLSTAAPASVISVWFVWCGLFKGTQSVPVTIVAALRGEFLENDLTRRRNKESAYTKTSGGVHVVTPQR
jgi:hypothetical protein